MTDNLKLVSGGDDIKIWELPELRLVHTIRPHSNAVSSLAWSPNNNFLASTALGEPVVVTTFNKSTPSSVELQGCENDTCVAFHSSSRHLLTAGKDKTLSLWDLKTRSIKKKIKDHSDAINCVTFNWNDTNIASGTTNGDILIHNITTTMTSTPLRLPQTQSIHAIQYSRFKKAFLGSVSDDGALNIWDTNTKKTVISFPDEHTAPAMDLSFSPMNDMLLASVGLDKRIVFYDIQGKKVIKDMQAESPLTSISFMQDGAAFAVGTTRGKIYLYDLRSGSTPLHSTVAHKTTVQSVSFQLPHKGSSSSSATLAAKFSSRSGGDAAGVKKDDTGVKRDDAGTKKDGPPPLPPGIPGKPRYTDSVQNGVQHNTGSDIFSPLREGTAATAAKDLEPNDDDYEPINSKKTDNITASGIFSPINSSTQPYRPSTTKSSANPTPAQNGHSPSYEDIPSVTRQPVTFPVPTSQVPERGSTLTHASESPKKDKHKSTLTRKVSLGKQHISNKLTKSSSFNTPRQSEGSTSRNITQTSDSSTKVEEMASARLTGSREGMVFDDTFEVLNGFVQPTMNNGESAPGFHEYQIQFVKNLIDDSLDEFRVNFHQDIVNLQLEMLRQFHIQQNEMKALLQQYSINEALVAENEQLKEEIKKLKSTH